MRRCRLMKCFCRGTNKGVSRGIIDKANRMVKVLRHTSRNLSQGFGLVQPLCQPIITLDCRF